MKSYVSSHLKDMNRRNVYKLLCGLEETSKSELANITGISPPTVMKIIQFLEEKGLVTQVGPGEAALGRKPQLLRLNKDRFYSIGVVHEGDYLKVGLVNLKNELTALKRLRVKGDLSYTMEKTLLRVINELLVETEVPLSDVLGIGMGLPAIYDVEREKILMAPLIGIPEEMEMGPILRKIESYYHKSVTVDNDLNMEVMGEFLSLKLTENNDLLYISFGTGIGGGVILNGRLRRGRHYMCGEVGYMTFLDDYVANASYGGWLEGKINLEAIQEKFGLGPDGSASKKDRDLAIEYAATCGALCVNNMMMCYDCDNISLGGELFDLLGEKMFRTIKEKVERLSVGGACLRRSSCRAPGVLGAAAMARDTRLWQILEES